MSFVEELLEEQQRLTAVERFASWHDGSGPAVGRSSYRELIPLESPKGGEQYAFQVDLDSCTGCKACVAACHSLNGLDDDETWRDVGLLVGGSGAAAIQQHVTTTCHHCLDPACLDGCPVEAYDKDPVTGIVRHLDDQCIGCRYCTLTCPYDAPKYNHRLGIVRKCDMCADRLAVNEAPACVQGCPNEAIRITIVDRDEVTGRAAAKAFLPGTPNPSGTRPTTIFSRSSPFPAGVLAADTWQVRPSDAHTPLALMLVLTQLSVGGFLVGRTVEAAGFVVSAPVRTVHTSLALVLGLVALGASVLHLGRPLYAWRAVLGVRTSWLSREILAFSVFAVLAAAYAWLGAYGSAGGWIHRAIGVAVVATGLAGVGCSILLYHDTGRELWRADRTALRFLSTTLILGIATTLFAGAVAAALSPDPAAVLPLAFWGRPLFGALAAVASLKLASEALLFRFLREPDPTPMKRTAILLSGELQQTTVTRFATGIFGGLLAPLFYFTIAERNSPAIVGVAVGLTFLFVVIGEILERSLFFRASAAPRMPGGPA